MTIKKCIQEAELDLKTAKMGYSNLSNKDNRKEMNAGLRNVAVFGRAVTNKLQNLRSEDVNFEKWYKPYRKEMQEDELMQHFYQMRSEVLKDSEQGFDNSFVAKDVTLPPSDALPNVQGQFMDKGGVGFHLLQPDGSTKKFYYQVPEEAGYFKYEFDNPPTEHLGEDVSDESIEDLCRLYLVYLREMVIEAKETFLSE